MKKTTREEIREILESYRETPSSICEYYTSEDSITKKDVLKHIEHIRKTLRNEDKKLVVIPPECKSCGFNEYDNKVNIPSRCPNCKSERTTEPVFAIV